MKTFRQRLLIASFLALASFGVTLAAEHVTGTVQVAQSSCRAMQSLCAARCKQRVPDDKNCVSDHCTPKLEECRQTGCWQEGKMYGGKLSCNLKKA